MKRNYQSGAQKRQAKRGKIAEAARNSQQLSLQLTRPEIFKANEQDVSTRETENSDTTKDRSDASKNDFSTIFVNSRNQLLQQVPNNLKDLSLKIRFKVVVNFQQIITIL